MATASERRLSQLTEALAETQTELAAVQARVDEERRLALTVFPSLPTEVVELIFSFLPVDSRLRAREVSRGFLAFLAQTHLWHTLRLSRGVAPALRDSPSFLRAAAARADGQLRVLDMRGRRVLGDAELRASDAAVLAVVEENGSTLTDLLVTDYHTSSATHLFYETAEIEAFQRAAPGLRMQLDVLAAPAHARDLLLNQPPFQHIQVHHLWIECVDGMGGTTVSALLEAVGQHASLRGLHFAHVELSEADLDAIVTAKAALPRWRHLGFTNCGLAAAHSLPAITRLLSAPGVEELSLYGGRGLFIGPALPAFCAALRASRLSTLMLACMGLFDIRANGLQVLRSLVGHPTLRVLDLSYHFLTSNAASVAVSRLLAQLLRMNSQLHCLNVNDCALNLCGLEPLFAAVAVSTTLRQLCCTGNGISPECVREVVLPAIQANTSLVYLEMNVDVVDDDAVYDAEDGAVVCPELDQARAIVRARAAAEAAAA